MAEEASEDTFVSVDLYAPTQSSVGISNSQSEGHLNNNDTISLSEFIAEDGLLEEDLLDAGDSQPSTYDSHSMRLNPNRQDSAFMWSLQNDPSPETYRQVDTNDQSEHHEESFSCADEADVCASFDTGTFSARFDPATPHHHSSSSHLSAYQSATPDTPASQNLSVGAASTMHARVSVSGQRPPRTPGRRSTPSRPEDRPPLPPNRNSLDATSRLSEDGHHFSSQTPHSTNPQSSTSIARQSVNQYDAQSSATEDRVQLYDPRFEEASRGFSTCVIENPFSIADTSNTLPKDIVVISKIGPVSTEERSAFQELATVDDPYKISLVRRLVETISFQHQQLGHVKDSEVNLADSIIQGHVRRYSDVAQERTYAMEALVQEIDSQRNRMTDLEDENEELRSQLEQSDNKNIQIEEYYSTFAKDFKLSDDVVHDLERVNEDVNKFRRESIEQCEKKDMQIEDYASRLLQMESLVADSRKRVQRVESNNANLRTAIRNDDEQNNEDRLSQSPEQASRHISPQTVPAEEHADVLETVREQEFELDNLRLLHEKAEEDRRKVQEAFLSLNLDMEEARSKTKTLQSQRDSAEAKCRDLNSAASEEKKKLVLLSNEMSKNIVQVVSELDDREADLRGLRVQLDDRESAFRSLKCSNQDLEDQLQSLTDTALDKSRSRNMDADNERHHPLVDAVIESLRNELDKAQSLLQERAVELDMVRKQMHDQDESFIGLQKECSRLQAAAAVRRRSGSIASLAPDTNTSEEDRFLRRLSQKLGCKPNSNRDLVEQLAKRVETLMVERAEFQEANENYRLELTERERALHKLRSEMQAEISALKAEGMHLENLKTRAQEDLQTSESRLLQVLGEGDASRRESMADMTVSSVGTRAWMIGDETDLTSRRGSVLSSVAGDDTVRWNDPIIDAAVQSVGVLIGTKDDLAARNRELREKLQNLINSFSTNDGDGSTKATMIQSKELQNELTGVVNLQQEIIARLGQSHSNTPRDETLPYIQMGSASRGANDENTTVSTIIRAPLGEATGFLNEQLTSTRYMYAEKLKANVELCGVVDELKEEIQYYKNANTNVESALTKLQETHDVFVSRLAHMTGADKSIVSLEDFIRASLHDMYTLQSELERKDLEERMTGKRLCGLIAQKRVLMHMIGMYQSKYKLNILATAASELSNVKRRLRIRLFAVVAFSKLNMLKSKTGDVTAMNVNNDYNLPPEIDITHSECAGVGMIEASLAIAAVPRLERALIEKEDEISRLETSIESLNRSAASLREGTSGICDMPQSSYVYEDDLMSRKNDLSRRLQKVIREKEEMDTRLSAEKKSRMTAEGRVARYMEKVATYKKRLGKISSHAEARENSYKAAIRYLKIKADKAIQNDFNMDNENVAPCKVEVGLEEDRIVQNVAAEPNATSRATLHEQLSSAESALAGLHTVSPRYEIQQKYVEGLRRTIQRLEKPTVFTRRAQTDGSNLVKQGVLMN